MLGLHLHVDEWDLVWPMKFPAWIFDKKYKDLFIFVLIFQEKLHALTESRGLEDFENQSFSIWKTLL